MGEVKDKNQNINNMQWTKPEFEEISLNMEVTAYVNVGS
jgi:coenzyme PQQ precursor peptide PqqA